MFETHQDGTISVVFGCDFNCLSSVKPGAEVKRFKVWRRSFVGAGCDDEVCTHLCG